MVRLRPPNRPATPGLFSRRDLWRLFSLVLGMAMVGFLIREFNRPQVAARVDQVMAVAVAEPAEPVAPPPPAAPADPAQFRQLLDLAGWDAARFATLSKAGSLTEAERLELVELLWRLRTFDGPQLTAWAKAGANFSTIAAAPNEHVGELVELTGKVTKAERHELPADLATRLEIPAYYECEMTLEGGAGVATLITGRTPRAWLESQPLNEPATVAGVFIKLLSPTDAPPHSLFVSREIAWHPVTPRPPQVSFGKSVLGDLRVDVGLLDAIRQRRPISSEEREAFYQILDASGRIGANQLARFATQNLASVSQRFNSEKNASNPARQQLAREVTSRAAKGLYSVAPLFNDAAKQVGELVVLKGLVRRVQRIDVGRANDGTPSDVARRFGIDHYYEIDLFTDDSQNNPIVFCVRELPPGMPTGDRLDVPVRIAGFFFKSWSFESISATLPAAADPEKPPGEMRQFAPLVIGRGPIMLELPETSPSKSFGLIAAGVFVVVLGAVWAAGWWLAREDRRFVRSTLAEQFSVPPGESLNDLDFDLSEPPREHE